jgi:hypothetical protein
MPDLLRAFFWFVYVHSNRLLSNARSSSPSTSNSSCDTDTRQDKKKCLEDILVLVLDLDRELLEHGIYELTREMCNVLVLSPVGREESGLNLSVPDMSILQLLPNPAAKSSV